MNKQSLSFCNLILIQGNLHGESGNLTAHSSVNFSLIAIFMVNIELKSEKQGKSNSKVMLLRNALPAIDCPN